MEFTVGLSSPFNLNFTLDSGQVFRWERRGEWWLGVVPGGALKLQQEGETLKCSTSSELLDSAYVSSYFRLGDPLEAVFAAITRDQVLAQAVQRFYGLRLIRQERWECLASFLLATNANIPRIKKMVASLCELYGEPFEFEGERYHLFPKPETLSGASVPELRKCGLGYRAPFIKRVATAVADGAVDFSAISKLDYLDSKKVLLKELLGEKPLLGVGPKVADCVLLYSCDKDDAFPIDVWMARALTASFPKMVGPRLGEKLRRDPSAKISPSEYQRVSDAARSHFGKYAGYAQLYLYVAARSATS
jgi:N-glycosylase/DNA lyase